MSKYESTLNLPVDDLRERRSILESELSKVIADLVTKELRDSIISNVKDIKITRITWDFYPESDDEGGTDWHTNDICVYGEDGEIDTEEITITQTYSYGTYDVELRDIIYDVLAEYRDDLYDQYITEIDL